MSRVMVNVDNFARAESDRMFAAIQAQAGGVNRWLHYRAPTPIDQQTVIRMNRHTLYSAAVSVMIVDQDHYINAVFREPGEHDLAVEQFGTSFVLVVPDPG